MKTNFQIYLNFLKTNMEDELLYKAAKQYALNGIRLDEKIIDGVKRPIMKHLRTYSFRRALYHYKNNIITECSLNMLTRHLFFFIQGNEAMEKTWEYEKYFFKQKYNISTETIVNTFIKHYNLQQYIRNKKISKHILKYYGLLSELLTLKIGTDNYYTITIKIKNGENKLLSEVYKNYINNIYNNTQNIKLNRNNIKQFLE